MTEDIYDQLDQMSVEELRALNAEVVERIKADRKIKAKRKIRSLNVGDRVEVLGDDDIAGEQGHVIKPKRTKVLVMLDNGEKWNIDGTLIKKVEE